MAQVCQRHGAAGEGHGDGGHELNLPTLPCRDCKGQEGIVGRFRSQRPAIAHFL